MRFFCRIGASHVWPGGVLLSVLMMTLSGTGCGPEGETGADETRPPDSEETLAVVEVIASGPIVCANPEARQAGPLYLHDPGPEWSVQYNAFDLENVITGGGVAVADLTGDSLLDIYLTHAGPDQLYIGHEDGTFTDESIGRLPQDVYSLSSGSTGVTSTDVEGDGDLDLFISNGNPNVSNALYINDGTGHFSDGTGASGLGEFFYTSLSASWADTDLDGDLDLYVGNHYPDQCPSCLYENPVPADPNEYYLNNGDGTFTDVSADLPAPFRDGYTFIGGWIYADDDLYPDLYMVNDYGPIPGLTPNLLGRNLGDGRIEVAPDAAGANVGIFGMGLGVGDLNYDGVPDLFCSSWAAVLLLVSIDSMAWVDETQSRNLTIPPDKVRCAGWGTALADMDNDGDLDALASFGYLANVDEAGAEAGGYCNTERQPDALFIQGESGAFDQQAEAWGVADLGASRGFVLTDMNNDGYLDIVKRVLGENAKIYWSRCGSDSWMRVIPRWDSTNTHAVGARVEVFVGDRTYTNWVMNGTVLQSNGPGDLHFGLGKVSRVDDIRIVWPDGQASHLGPMDANQIIEVTRTQ